MFESIGPENLRLKEDSGRILVFERKGLEFQFLKGKGRNSNV